MLIFDLAKTSKQSNKKIISSHVFYSLLCCLAFNATAKVQFSKYRVNLDEEHREFSLSLMSSSRFPNRCTLGVNQLNVLEDGTIKVISDDKVKLNVNSANTLFRYSPSRITIPANGTQAVKLKLKRTRNLEQGEYTSFLSISCAEVYPPKSISEVTDQNIVEQQVNTNIVYNIPVIIRKGELSANGKIVSADINPENILTIKLSRQGNRSLHGDVTVIDTKTNKVIGLFKGLTAFLPAKNRTAQIKLLRKPQGHLHINFKEVKSEGGEQEFSYTLAL